MSSGKCLFLITGASQGLGRGIAQVLTGTLFKQASDGSKLVLLARNSEKLNETKNLVEENTKEDHVVVETISMDLSRADAETEIRDLVSRLAGEQEYNTVYLFNNAGVQNHPNKTIAELNSQGEIQHVINVNFVSACHFVSSFTRHFAAGKKLYLIHMSSSSAVQPFANMSVYGATKAGTDMLFRTTAAEYPKVRALNFSPAIVQTAMMENAEKNGSDFLKMAVARKKKDEKVYYNDPVVAMRKMIQFIETDEFESGVHIDLRTL